jgi:hypothetical protein
MTLDMKDFVLYFYTVKLKPKIIIFMKKVKKYLWAMVVMTGMLFSCGEPVVMDRPSSAFLSLEKNFDYQAKTNQKMSAVKKWYEKHTENGKEEINIKVQGLAGGDYFIKYPTPIVKSPDLLSINDATVAGRGVTVNHLEIMADGSLVWNGNPENIDNIYNTIVESRENSPSEYYIFISVDEETSFEDYINVKNILYRYYDHLSNEYYSSSYITLSYDEKEKLHRVYIISDKEYIYDASKIKR